MKTENFTSRQDHTKKILYVDEYEVVASFSDEPRPDTFQTIRRILLLSPPEKETVDAA